MIASREFGYVYPALAKTGSASVRAWLVDFYRGVQIAKYHSMIVPDLWRGMFVFVTVRNPYERLYSLWCYANKRGRGRRLSGMTFEESTRNYAAMGHGQYEEYQQVGASMFLKVEQLAEEVKRLPFYRADVPAPGYLRRNTNKALKPTASFFDFCTERDQRVVEEVFARDFDFFGYDKA